MLRGYKVDDCSVLLSYDQMIMLCCLFYMTHFVSDWFDDSELCVVSTWPKRLEYSRFKSLMINEIETEGLLSTHLLLLSWHELIICVVTVSFPYISLILHVLLL